MLISPLLATLQKKLKTSSPAPLFSTSQTASNAVIPTASAHNYSSTPHHNLAPSHSRVISLHAHSVATAMHSFLYNISHTPRERSPHALPCSNNGETAAEKKETTNKADLNPNIRKCSHWCGDLILCYNATIIFKFELIMSKLFHHGQSFALLTSCFTNIWGMCLMQVFTLGFLQLYVLFGLYAITSLPNFKRRGLVNFSSMDYLIFTRWLLFY